VSSKDDEDTGQGCFILLVILLILVMAAIGSCADMVTNWKKEETRQIEIKEKAKRKR